MERDFDPATSFDDIKKTILNDEATMFALLNVEESDS